MKTIILFALILLLSCKKEVQTTPPEMIKTSDIYKDSCKVDSDFYLKLLLYSTAVIN